MVILKEIIFLAGMEKIFLGDEIDAGTGKL